MRRGLNFLWNFGHVLIVCDILLRRSGHIAPYLSTFSDFARLALLALLTGFASH